MTLGGHKAGARIPTQMAVSAAQPPLALYAVRAPVWGRCGVEERRWHTWGPLHTGGHSCGKAGKSPSEPQIPASGVA